MSLEVSNVSKYYATQKALNQVSFNLNKGEVVGFLGPNGAGKSTMMKMITTYIEASEGNIRVDAQNIKDNTLEVKKKIGYLPEHNPIYLDLFVKEYLQFHANIHQVRKERINEVINLVGLTPEQNKKVGQLSKGYRQRVGLAAALLHDPEILILDEPTTGLDPNQLADIRELIKNIGKTKTVLLSTHIMQEVEAMCNRVIIINKGNIVADKQIAELLKEQAQIIEVEFDVRVEEQLLKQIDYVRTIKNIGDNIWHLSFDTDQDMRSLIFDFAQVNGLRTLQLKQKVNSLEQLFRNLTA